jgi:hypothetical protein
MNANRIDLIARSLSDFSSRRNVLHGLFGVGFGLAAFPGWPGGEAAVDAKKKRKHKQKNKKPEPRPQPPPAAPFNDFGCLDVGQPCQGDSALCCSGICDPGTSTCVAHNSGACFPDTTLCASDTPLGCGSNPSECLCMLTTGNATFCADLSHLSDLNDFPESCRFCSADTDCQEELGPGAACVVLAGACTPFCLATGRTACVAPCA